MNVYGGGRGYIAMYSSLFFYPDNKISLPTYNRQSGLMEKTFWPCSELYPDSPVIHPKCSHNIDWAIVVSVSTRRCELWRQSTKHHAEGYKCVYLRIAKCLQREQLCQNRFIFVNFSTQLYLQLYSGIQNIRRMAIRNTGYIKVSTLI
jgi:hypothetical protein